MTRLLILASQSARMSDKSDLLRGLTVVGCATALIVARMPFGF